MSDETTYTEAPIEEPVEPAEEESSAAEPETVPEEASAVEMHPLTKETPTLEESAQEIPVSVTADAVP